MPIKDPEKLKAAQKRYNEKRKTQKDKQRVRSWACIVYPESAPADWLEALKGNHVQALVSPLHDSDVTATGEPKKPHYHVMLMFDNPVPESKARGIFETIGVTAPPEKLQSTKAYARYLVHMDDHDKHRYRDQDVMELCGASWAGVALDEAEEKDRLLDEIEDYIDEYSVVSYRALLQYARHSRPEWKRVIRSNTIHLTNYVKSLAWEETQEQGR